MILSNLVVIASSLIAILSTASTHPQPGVIRERHIIHAPIKFRIIHHYRIQKVPITIRKHLHYYKNGEEKKPPVETDESNHIHHEEEEDDRDYHDGHPNEDHYYPIKSPDFSYYQNKIKTHEDYEEPQQSQEDDDYENYEYE